MSAPLKIVRRAGAVCEAGQHGACMAADSSAGFDSDFREAWVCSCVCHYEPRPAEAPSVLEVAGVLERAEEYAAAHRGVTICGDGHAHFAVALGCACSCHEFFPPCPCDDADAQVCASCSPTTPARACPCHAVHDAWSAEYERMGMDLIQDDMTELMRVLGISVHARPCSPHDVMLNEIIPAVRRLAQR